MKRIHRFPWRGLTPQLFLLVILPLTVLLLLVTYGGLTLHHQAMRELVGERDVRAIRAAASSLDEQLYHRLNSIRAVALRVPLTAEEADQILSEYEFLQADFEGGLAIYSPEGAVLASTGSSIAWENLFSETAPELQAIFEPRAELGADPAALSQAHVFPGQAEGPVMFAAAQAEPDGIIAVGAFYPASMARRTLADITGLNPSGEVFLVNAQGQVIYYDGQMPAQGAEYSDLTGHPGLREALAGSSGADFLDDSEMHLVIAYGPVPLTGWALVIEEPWDSVTSPMLRLTENAPLVLIPVVIISVVALWFGTTRLVQPLQQLESKAARLGWGDYEAIEQPVGGVSEIRHLQGELVHLAHKVKAAQQGLRNYIGAMTAGQEDERRRLARELHDDTIQSLIALNQRIQLLRMQVEELPPANEPANGIAEEVKELQDLAEGTIQNLRRLTRALRPIYLEDLGLTTALEMLTREISQASGIPVSYRQAGNIRRLDAEVELALYRMAQEALNNVVRHAQASEASLRIDFDPNEIRLEITDNGRGFNVPESPAEFAPGGHFGLLGLHERVEMIGAALKIESQPGQGSRVFISLKNDESSSS